MILYYEQIQRQIQHISSQLLTNCDHGSAHIQKIFSTAKLLCLSIRIPGSTFCLYLGRGQGAEGVWLSDKKPASKIRIKDKYLDYLRRYLTGGRVIGISLDKVDRIITLKYFKNGGECYYSIFYKGRDCYFINSFRDPSKDMVKVFLSWRGEIALEERYDEKMILDFFDEVGRLQTRESIDNPKKIELGPDKILREELKLLASKTQNKKTKNFLKRKIENIEKDLVKCSKWKILSKQIESLELDKLDQIKLSGVRIKLNRTFDHYKNLDLVYKKIKGFRKGETLLNIRLAKTKEEQGLAKKSEITKSDYRKLVKISQPIWPSSSKGKNQKKNLPEATNLAIYEIGQVEFAIGLDARSNDYLRNTYAKKTDTWIHLEGYKGSHCIIGIDRWENIGLPVLEVIVSALVFHSKLSIGLADIIYTQVKNLRGVKGGAGKVLYKKEKYLTVSVDFDWKDKVSEK